MTTEDRSLAVPVPDSAGQLVSEQVLREQAWEESIGRSLEDRAGRLIALSLALLGFSATLIGDEALNAWLLALGAAGAALVVAAAATSVSVMIPSEFERGDDEGYLEYLAQANIAVRHASYSARKMWLVQINTLVSTRAVNTEKAQRLSTAIYLVIAGTALVVISLVGVTL